MKKLDRDKIKIPPLPYGQGSISFFKNDTLLVYKKTINGNREAVYGESVREVMDKMRDLEIELSSNPKQRKHRNLDVGEKRSAEKKKQKGDVKEPQLKVVESKRSNLLKDVMKNWLHAKYEKH